MTKYATLTTKHKFLLITAVILLTIASLNSTGFCYSELQYLSERKLVDRYLFGEEADKLTEQQKIENINARGGEYPNCCRITGEPFDISKFDKVLNKIFGRYLYAIEFNFRREKPSEKNYPYYAQYDSINACATRVWNGYGSSENEKGYKFNIKQIEKHWKDKK